MSSYQVLNLSIICVLVASSHVVVTAFGFGSDRVLLSDIQVLTLKQGQVTNGRRSSPVPQLNCVGGTAKSLFNPSVVQCYNRGFDGYDVQWECKADMDNAYRFGQVEVTCEGYDSPEDDYILKGSCGLEYTLELTEEGRQKQNSGSQYSNAYHGNQGGNSYSHYAKRGSSIFGDLVALAIVALIVYGLYRMCLAPPGGDNSSSDSHRTSDWGSTPPPPGFRSDYMPGNDSCSGSSSRYGSHGRTHTSGSTNGGGFWTGAATGGLLGYLFGSRGSHTYNRYHQPGYQPYNSWWGNPSSGWSSGWGGSHRSTFSGGSSGGFSSGTRTASGFGGTRRR